MHARVELKRIIRKTAATLGIVVLMVGAFLAGGVYSALQSGASNPPSLDLSQTVSLSRSPEWKYGPGFYVAVVSAQEAPSGQFKVSARIHVGNSNYTQLVELGWVDSFHEALSRWGRVEWSDTELVIGSQGTHSVRIARQQIETHR